MLCGYGLFALQISSSWCKYFDWIPVQKYRFKKRCYDTDWHIDRRIWEIPGNMGDTRDTLNYRNKFLLVTVNHFQKIASE